MSHIFGYLCSDPSVSTYLLRALEAEVSFTQPSESSGIGLGWIQDERALLRNHPKPPSGLPSVLTMVSDLPSRTVLGQVREPGRSPLVAADLAPFRFKKWLWVSPGEGEVPEGFLSQCPDHIRQNIRGDSPAEWVFHAVLAELSRAELLEHPERDTNGVLSAFSRAIKQCQEAGLSVGAVIMATNKRMLALSTTHTLSYRVVSGYEIQEEPLFAGHKPRTKTHPAFRATMLTTAPTQGEWQEVPANHVAWFDAQGAPSFQKI